MTPQRLHQPWVPYLFLSPFIFTVVVFIAYPLIQSIVLSLQQTYGPALTQFVFALNYIRLFNDPLFWIAMRNTFLFAGVSLLIQFPLALGLALLLNQPWLRGRLFFRLVFFSPSLIGPVFAGLAAFIIFQKRTGLLNLALNRLFGFNPDFPWMQEYVLAAVIIASLWMYLGLNMIFFYAALQNVDHELLDAARIDGAGSWHRFVHITLPSIRPVAAFVVLLSLIGSFQLFELPWMLLGGSGGPANQGLTIVMYLYQHGFEAGDLGYASAIGWMLAGILMTLTAFQRVYFGSREEL